MKPRLTMLALSDEAPANLIQLYPGGNTSLSRSISPGSA